MKIFLKILIFSILLQILISPVRGLIGIQASTLLGFIAYFVFAYFCHRMFGQRISIQKITLIIIAGILIVQLPLRISSFSSSVSTLPDMIFNVVGAFSYYVYVKLNGYVKWVTLLLLLIAPLFMAVKGYALWFNKLDNGTFEGETFFKMEALYTVVEESGKLVGASDLHGKLVLMDFWFSGCKPCFEEFPELQKIHNKYKGNKKVNIYSVNLPVRSDSVNQAFNTLRKEGYDFPMLILKTDGKPNVFDIKSCPTAVVLNVEGDIIFKGNLLKAEKYMDKLLK